VRILFRTDANAQIGTGHLMRCLALADGLRAEGAECTFLCRSNGLGALAERIVAGGHTLAVLPESELTDFNEGQERTTQHKCLVGGWRNDVDSCLKVLEGYPVADWLVVDHYAIDSDWEIAMQFAAKRIMVIDDLADRSHQCDVLLDQNVLSEMDSRYREFVPEKCEFLLGPKFALLRTDFSLPLSHSLDIGHGFPDLRLFIMFGGSDPQNLTLRAVMALVRIGWEGTVDVVVGSLYQNAKEISDLLESLPNAHLHVQANNIADLIRSAGLAIGSPGVASWERCACALPTIALSAAENQLRLGETLGLLGAHWYLGLADEVSDAQLDAALLAWGNNSIARKCMRDIAKKVCDGKGVHRVVQRLVSSSVVLRPARESDASMLYLWRNDERTRRFFFNASSIEFGAHLAWFGKTLNSSESQLLIACRSPDTPVACVRIDYFAERAKLSIYVDPDLHGNGLGKISLDLAIQWLRNKLSDVKIAEADVMVDNTASNKAFQAAGFREMWRRYEYIL